MLSWLREFETEIWEYPSVKFWGFGNQKMLSSTPSAIARSSLEEMLESIRRRGEEEKPKDLPPALPARPTSRARLPSAGRSLPNKFRIEGDQNATTGSKNNSNAKAKEGTKKKEGDAGHKRKGSFASKKMKQDIESPYIVTSEENMNQPSSEDAVSVYTASIETSGKIQELAGDDNVAYYIKKKLRVWCRSPSGRWALGQIQSTSGDEAFVSLSNGGKMKVARSELLPANPDILEGVDDLIQLSYLNEPSVLHNLQFRYSQDMIYNKAGPVLIALNPFKEIQIYGNDYISAYRQKTMDSPHVYAMADVAFNEMMRGEVNQSIIISGESGSGKTETAKFAMQYLAVLSGSSCGIEKEVLQTNCILEAFGNAKTSRNDNSSRFGKLIEIHFSALGRMCGAKIQTFLLEKSRVVQLTNGERSYHIFYQLCAGSSPDIKERLNLKAASEYKYLSQSDCMTIDGIDDVKKFHKLMKALDDVRICKEDQELVFKMIAAILWLGNISFKVTDNENHIEVVDDEAVTSAALLMGCSSKDLMVTLSTRKIQAGKDSIAKRLTLWQATDTRDGLAKFIYASLFDWLVEQINKSLEVGKRRTGRSISILDIYGFESFQKNSFEQFCINYANERLQQHFNRHLFKLEQDDYELDGVDWTKVDFEDNQECLDLFEKKPLGLISLLDEESNFPKATDITFANKLRQYLNANPCFKGERGRGFCVRHYAGEVSYDTNGFLEKNRDPLPSDSIQLLSSCNCQLLQLFSKKIDQSKHSNSSHVGALGSQKQSVGTTFKGQLFKLMNQLESTTPHFIRCIKPNTRHSAGIYDEDLVLQQLMCCGVLEIVRISRAGYPTRILHQEFARRYGFFLLSEASASQDPLSISVSVLQQFNIPPEMYQVGYTKLYLRGGQIGVLEDRRKKIIVRILRVQKWLRGHQARRNFYVLKNGAIALQSIVRREIARKTYHAMKSASIASEKLHQTQAITRLQSVIRGWLVRRRASSVFHKLKKDGKISKHKQKSRSKMTEVKQDLSKDQVQNLPSTLELQNQVVKAETTLKQKEEENTALREQLKQFETRWIEYEMKMKSMEQMWQKQMASLQSLSVARRSLAAENSTDQPGRYDAMSPCFYDSEDATSMESRTPAGSTPIKFPSTPFENGAGRNANDTFNAVSNLMKEFEQRRQIFDDDAKALLAVKLGRPAHMNPNEELRQLKRRFEGWKKEYKGRLRETKARLCKTGSPEAEISCQKWWGKISSRGL
ncbi:myosin-2 isoform X3 [Prosopis cineraria]|uniref:myosin-2 isoform X3 n=1 Tax=Prosopis cineraria TaxID=364024 RepID=UPI00240FCE4B|nr:myosin-2 isoform X3 [Prosopis cineraria]